MAKVTRRQFMKACAAAGVGVGFSKVLGGCTMCAGPQPLPDIPFTPTDASAEVFAVRGLDLKAMTRQAIDAVGGMGSIVQPNETVFIKPNFGTAGFVNHNLFKAGECTKPEIVLTVAEECLKAGAAEVIIGEGGQVAQFDWSKLLMLDDSANMMAEALRLSDTYSGTVTLACLEVDSPAWDAVPSPYTGLGSIYISSLLARADRVISLPVAKTHRWCVTTGALKNFVGTTSLKRYSQGSPNRTILHQAAGGVHQCFLDIVSAVKVDLSIMDMSICCEGDGPHVLEGWWGSTIDVKDRLGDWLLLAGTDPVALDATATRIIGRDVADVYHLDLAYREGLGQSQADKIELIGASLDELQMEWIPAKPTKGFCEVIIPGIMMMME